MNQPDYSSDDDSTSSAESETIHPPSRPPLPPPARNVRPRHPIAVRSQAPIGQHPPMGFRSQAPNAQHPPMALRSQAPNAQPRPMALRSQAPNAQPRPIAFRSQAPSAQPTRPPKIVRNWLPSPYMTDDLVPYQLTPVRALAPEYSQTDTTNLAVPKLYAARIVQLKDELRLEDEGEAVKWLLKQSEPAIITATGTGTMPIMTSSSANVRGGGGPLVISAPLAGNAFAHNGRS